MLICLNHEGDFNRLWFKEIWYVESFSMRIFRWSPDFRSDIESSVVPLWVSLPILPLFLFNKQCLFSICCTIGTPLTIDIANAEITRPSYANICIQVDLLNRIWLECGKAIPGAWQAKEYENSQNIVNIA